MRILPEQGVSVFIASTKFKTFKFILTKCEKQQKLSVFANFYAFDEIFLAKMKKRI